MAHNLQCDACGSSPICGTAFRCTQCSHSVDTYDLCGPCHTKIRNNSIKSFGDSHESWHPVKCIQPESVNSIVAEAETEIIVANHSIFPVKVLWVDYNGEEHEYNVLNPGQIWDCSTSFGHTWRLRARMDNRLLLQHTLAPFQPCENTMLLAFGDNSTTADRTINNDVYHSYDWTYFIVENSDNFNEYKLSSYGVECGRIPPGASFFGEGVINTPFILRRTSGKGQEEYAFTVTGGTAKITVSKIGLEYEQCNPASIASIMSERTALFHAAQQSVTSDSSGTSVSGSPDQSVMEARAAPQEQSTGQQLSRDVDHAPAGDDCDCNPLCLPFRAIGMIFEILELVLCLFCDEDD